MMRIWRGIGVALVILLLGAAWWRWERRVDGRSASAWLLYAQRANQGVSYRAVGAAEADGHRTRFILDQQCDGCYILRSSTAGAQGKGRESTLGFDGHALWYQAGGKTVRLDAAGDPRNLPPHAACRIVGTGEWAERPVVHLEVHSGSLRKRLAIDRRTGVILGMITTVHGRAAGSMEVVGITYGPVKARCCATRAVAMTTAATPERVTAALGHPALRPQWLPRGITEQSATIGPCPCCGAPMVTLHYSDGLTTLTLFEMNAAHGCRMGAGCQQAPTGSALVETRAIGDTIVTAVSTMTPHHLQRMWAKME